MENAPQIEMPKALDINLSGDTLDMAKTMDDIELRALVINNYRMLCEILGFCRDMQGMLEAFAKNPMAKMMGAGGIQIPNGMPQTYPGPKRK